MAIIKQKSENNFTIISNEILKSNKLNMSEKGLLCYLLSLPENYVVSKTTLINNFNNGYTAISSIFDSLCCKGFIEVVAIGIDYEYNIYGVCQNKSFKTVSEIKNNKNKTILESTICQNGISGNIISESIISVNPMHINTKDNNNINKEKNNKIYMSFEQKYAKEIEVLKYLSEKQSIKFELNERGESNLKIIKARLNEYSIDELKQVVDYKCKEWKGNDEMKKFLKPTTLFAIKHCGTYLSESKTFLNKNENIITDKEAFRARFFK